MARPTWEQYALTMAEAAATRSEDPFVKVGAVVLRPDHSVAGAGYNGAPSGIGLDWEDRDNRRIFVIHAEVNALRYCTPRELGNGSLMAVTHETCASCLPHIAAYGIRRVVYRRTLEESRYPKETLERQAKMLGITMTQMED